MTEGRPTGTCKHGAFFLDEGCPQCIAEARQVQLERGLPAAGLGPPVTNIVKLQYCNSIGEPSGRAYSFFSIDPLAVGDYVQVPTDYGSTKGRVTAVNVPESEIVAFRDRVKTIPSGSIRPGPESTYQSPPDLVKLVAEATNPNPETETREMDPLSKPDLPLITEGEQTIQSDDEVAAEMFEAHNDGKAVIAVQPEVDEAIIKLFAEGQKALEYAKARIIETNSDLESATNDLVSIKNLTEAMEAKRKEWVNPIRRFQTAVNDQFKRLLFPFEEANTITRGKINEFRAIEKAKIDLQKREAEAKGGATTIERQTPVPEVTRTDLGTAGSRTVWHFEILDFAQVPDEYKLPNDSKIMSHARTTKGKRPIPGIKIWSEKEVTVRRRKGE